MIRPEQVPKLYRNPKTHRVSLKKQHANRIGLSRGDKTARFACCFAV